MLAVILALPGSSCLDKQATALPVAQTSVLAAAAAGLPPTLAAVASADASAEPAPAKADPLAEWVYAVRHQHWADAKKLAEALPDADKARPEVRYARGRVAIALGEEAAAVSLLEGLEAELPSLAKDIERWRALAAVQAGPYDEAAAYFGRSKRAEDLVRAAAALERGGQGKAAAVMVNRAITAAQKAKDREQEAEGRSIRARLASASGKQALAQLDCRWIARHAPFIEAPTLSEGIDKAKKTLSPKERLDGISDLIDRGRTRDALEALSAVEGSPGFPKLTVAEYRANALYKARDYAKAADAFTHLSKLRADAVPEPLYYAARALSRADKVEDAVSLYSTISKRFAKSFYGERATFFSSRLLVQLGRFDDATTAYSRYLSAYPRGDNRREAEYERTLAVLSSTKPAKARLQLRQLAGRAKGDEVNKLLELEAVAALRAGDRDAAVKTWTTIIDEQPLSWAALVARSRLAESNAPVPAPIARLSPTEATPAAAYTPLDLRLPPTVALLASVGLDADAEEYLSADEKGAAKAYSGREGEALCGMYGMLAGAKRRYRVGAAAVRYSVLTHAPAPSERWAWDCLYPRPYEAYVRELEREYKLPKDIMYAIMRQESAFNAEVVSPASAVGLMQLMPGTARRVAAEIGDDIDPTDLTNPEVNLRLGAYYIAKLLDMFQGNILLATASYNAGPIAVTDWLAGGVDHEADLWVARIPYKETRNYVARVMGNWARYQWLDGGDDAVTMPSVTFPKDARATADAY